jgi:integrase
MHLSIGGQCDANHRMRPRNADLRRQEHLTEAEVERLMEAAKGNRWGLRDATMVLVAYRHGLRASELVDLHWDQVDFRTGTLHVRRVKKGTPSTHPILGDELRALRRLQREQEPKSPFVFTSERGAPFTTAGFARMVERAGSEAKLGFKAHPHMLRHACGYALANRGHDTRALQAYLGHRNIQHTVRYSELAPTRFKDFWRRWFEAEVYRVAGEIVLKSVERKVAEAQAHFERALAVARKQQAKSWELRRDLRPRGG